MKADEKKRTEADLHFCQCINECAEKLGHDERVPLPSVDGPSEGRGAASPALAGPIGDSVLVPAKAIFGNLIEKYGRTASDMLFDLLRKAVKI